MTVEDHSPSRRTFLKESLLGVAVLSAAKVHPRLLLSDGVPAEVATQLHYFSGHEYMIVRAIAGCMVGRVPAETEDPIDAALRADQFLSTADEEVQDQIHQLLTAFNGPFFTFLFDFRFSSFLRMKPQDQDSYLEDWMTSTLAFRRKGFQALKRLTLSMYYTDRRSWATIGYHGMTPEVRP